MSSGSRQSLGAASPHELPDPRSLHSPLRPSPGQARAHTLQGKFGWGGGLLQYFVSGTILMNFGAGVNLTGIIIYKWANYPVVIFYKGVNPVYLLCFKTCTHLSSEKSHFGNNTISPCSFVSFLLFITRLEILRQMSEMEN